MLCRWQFLAGLCVLAATQPLAVAQDMVDCPGTGPAEPPAMITPQMLSDACIRGNPVIPLLYFDDYSWRTFLALTWPAKQSQRGQPDGSLPYGSPGRPVVFETFKSEWEVFRPNDGPRVAWNEYGGRADNPCQVDGLGFGDFALAGYSKFDNVIQAGLPKGALIAQNRTYVRHSAAFNEKTFQHILAHQYYLRSNLNNVAPFPVGAMTVKSAWVDMEGIQRPERFHTRDAWLQNLTTGACERKRVGLIGLHIVAKTPTRPQWIWSTFEHVDNVPGPQGSAPFTLNNGDGTTMPPVVPTAAKCPTGECQVPPAPPYNVQRLVPIHDQGPYSTAAMNAKYRAKIAEQSPNSPWNNYQLVMTQWPLAASRPDLDGQPEHTFPGTISDDTAFSNVTMETFKQTDVSRGCMGCHDQGKQFDFVFTLGTRSYPRGQSALPPSHLHALEQVGKVLK